MAKIIGFKTSKGNYQGYDYSNIVFYRTYENDNVDGLACEIIKVKEEVVNKFLKAHNLTLNLLLGENIQPVYDRNGRIIDLQLLSKK